MTPSNGSPCKEGTCLDSLVCHKQRRVCVLPEDADSQVSGVCTIASQCAFGNYCDNGNCVHRDQAGSKCKYNSCVDGYVCWDVCRLKCDLAAKESEKFSCLADEECTVGGGDIRALDTASLSRRLKSQR